MSATSATKQKSEKRKPSRERKPAMAGVGKDPATGRNIPHERDEKIAKRVGFYVAAGLTENDIAEMLNIRPGKLRECYGPEIKHGLNQANVEVAAAMHQQACNGDVAAGKFWLKARAGWKDGEGAAQTSPLSIIIHE